jgi:hypothetical protein
MSAAAPWRRAFDLLSGGVAVTLAEHRFDESVVN